MPPKERSLVRGIASDAWRDIRRRPVMWLILSAAFLPLIFFNEFLAAQPAFLLALPQTVFMLILIVCYAICFVIPFTFWCMAVFDYDGVMSGGGKPSYHGAWRLTLDWAPPIVRAGLVFGLANIMIFMFAQPLVGMLLSFVASGASDASLQVLWYLSYYLTYIVADLILVLIVMVPQMLSLERGRKMEEVFKTSYLVVKERYRNALLLLIVPEIIMRTIILGISIAIGSNRSGVAFWLPLLLLRVLLEGGRTAYIAAAFNRFYYHVLEEEAKKRKAKGKGKKQAAGKQPARKPSGKKPTGKQPPARKPPGKKPGGKQPPRKKPPGKK